MYATGFNFQAVTVTISYTGKGIWHLYSTTRCI